MSVNDTALNVKTKGYLDSILHLDFEMHTYFNIYYHT